MGLFQLTYLKRSKIKYCATDFQWLKIPSLLIVTLIFFSESLFSNSADFSSGLNILGDLEGQQVPATIMKSIENGKPWVFMGDPIDRGPHSLEFITRVAEQIENSASATDSSKKIGENILNELSCSSGCYSVFFSKPYTVADNRGTNKLRLLFELTSESLKKPPRNSSWKDFFDFVKEKTMQDTDSSLSEAEFIQRYRSDIVMRMKFILEKSMGAAKGFENRKLELERTLKRPVTDLEVVESMISDLKIQGRIGSLGKILLNNKVITKSKDGYVFIHGGILEESLGKVPTDKLDEMGNIIYEKTATFNEWVIKLNHFYHQQVFNALENNINPESLILYQEGKFSIKNGHRIRTQIHSESVIYGRYSDAQGNPIFPNEKVWSFLGSQNHTIVNAHTPVGKYPVLLLNSSGTKRLLLTDTSYSEERTHRSIQIQDKDIAIEFPVPQSDGGGIFLNFHSLGTKGNTSGDEKEGFRWIGFILRENGEIFRVKHRIGTLDGNPFQSIYITIPVDIRKLRVNPEMYGTNDVLVYAMEKRIPLFLAKKQILSIKGFSCLRSYQ